MLSSHPFLLADLAETERKSKGHRTRANSKLECGRRVAVSEGSAVENMGEGDSAGAYTLSVSRSTTLPSLV